MKTITQNTKNSPVINSKIQGLINVSFSTLTKSKVLVVALMIFILHSGITTASVNTSLRNYHFDKDSVNKMNANLPIKKTEAKNHNSVVFTVQIITLSGYLPANAKFFEKCGRADEHIINNQYIYTIGKFNTNEAAQRKTDELKRKGYNDAFPVAFINQNRVSVDELFAALNKN